MEIIRKVGKFTSIEDIDVEGYKILLEKESKERFNKDKIMFQKYELIRRNELSQFNMCILCLPELNENQLNNNIINKEEK